MKTKKQLDIEKLKYKLRQQLAELKETRLAIEALRDDTYHCGVCERSFGSENDLKKHNKTDKCKKNHGKTGVKCEACNRVFYNEPSTNIAKLIQCSPTISQYKAHLKQCYKKLHCECCDVDLPNVMALSRHKKTANHIKNKKDWDASNPKPNIYMDITEPINSKEVINIDDLPQWTETEAQLSNEFHKMIMEAKQSGAGVPLTEGFYYWDVIGLSNPQEAKKKVEDLTKHLTDQSDEDNRIQLMVYDEDCEVSIQLEFEEGNIILCKDVDKWLDTLMTEDRLDNQLTELGL